MNGLFYDAFPAYGHKNWLSPQEITGKRIIQANNANQKFVGRGVFRVVKAFASGVVKILQPVYRIGKPEVFLRFERNLSFFPRETTAFCDSSEMW
ncbi:MAG: hypothetical protein AB1427_19145 [Thermodesulfobacteriota bacterium]